MAWFGAWACQMQDSVIPYWQLSPLSRSCTEFVLFSRCFVRCWAWYHPRQYPYASFGLSLCVLGNSSPWLGEEGFGDVGPTSRLTQILYFTDVWVFPFAWEMCRIKRHPFVFQSRGVLWRFSTRDAPSRGSSNLTAMDSAGNRAKTALSVAFLGKLHKLNATTLPFM